MNRAEQPPLDLGLVPAILLADRRGHVGEELFGKPRRDFPLLAGLYLRGMLRLDELVSHTAGLDGLQEAFDALKAGAEARTVLLPHG